MVLKLLEQKKSSYNRIIYVEQLHHSLIIQVILPIQQVQIMIGQLKHGRVTQILISQQLDCMMAQII